MSYADILIATLCFAATIVVGVSILMLHVVKLFVKESLNPTPFATPAEKARKLQLEAEARALIKPKPALINRLMGLRPLAEEKELVMEHSFDGITELDNPTPRWFMALFYSTLIFAIVYLFNYEVFGFGPNQEEEYLAETEQAAQDKAAFLLNPENAKSAVNENNMVLSTDEAVLKQGAGLYESRCTPCHGAHAEGIVGPNLTDEFWLHGGDVKDVFKTIKYGVPEKGMIAWEKSLSAQQISDITNYVLSLQGTNPAGAKAAQGDKQK
jgi:cytochrome c oxidase cbb3-type subunit 3